MLTKRGNRNKSKRYASWRLCVRNADSAPKEEWWRKVDPLHHISLQRPMWVGRVRSSGTATPPSLSRRSQRRSFYGGIPTDNGATWQRRAERR